MQVPIPALGNGSHSIDDVVVEEWLTTEDGLVAPKDLAISPERPDQLWVVNQGDDSVVIALGLGTEDEVVVKRAGEGNTHFLASPAGIAFGQPGFLATCQETDEKTQISTPADFMGPTLWLSDAVEFDAGTRSHMDMLHNSPNGAGIAWQEDNTYWVFDGYHESLTRYAFNEPHEPGGTDHSDGDVARFVEGQVSYEPGVPSNLFYEPETGQLFVADTGNGRVAVLDTTTGQEGDRIGPNYDGTKQYRVDGASLTTFVDSKTAAELQRPSGLVMGDGVLYVADNETSFIFAFNPGGELLDWLDLSSLVPAGALLSLEVEASGNLLLIDQEQERVLRLSPKP